MNKTLIIVAIVLVAVFAGIYLYSNNNGDDNLSGDVTQDISPKTSSGVKEFTMIASRWKFEPNKITVNQGDLVRLKIISTDVAHGIAIPDYKINEYLSPGQTVNIEFVADRKGTFPFACSVSCGVGHSGMGGKLIVK